jgi:hypothetical protein
VRATLSAGLAPFSMALRYPVSPASPSMVCRLESSSHSQSSALCLAARRILVSPMTTTGALHLPLAPPIRSLPGLSSRDRSGCEDCNLGPATTSVPTTACSSLCRPAGLTPAPSRHPTLRPPTPDPSASLERLPWSCQHHITSPMNQNVRPDRPSCVPPFRCRVTRQFVRAVHLGAPCVTAKR